MEKELTKAEKGRKTKLSKMSNEELIAIILRKDETEHKYANFNKCLKKNVLGLEAKVKDKETRITELEDEVVAKDLANAELSKSIDYLQKGIAESQHSNEELHRNLVLRKRDLRHLLYNTCILAGAFVGFLIYHFCIE